MQPALNLASASIESRSYSLTERVIRKYPFLPAMIGTALEYYDASLYGFMAPLIAHLFWPKAHPTLAIVYSYAILSISILSSPLGAVLFGKIGDRFGRKIALILSISGMMLTTLLMAFMPTYASVGMLAPILLVIARTLQDFFSAGEYNGGAIYSLEHSSCKSFGKVSGLYCAFTVSGILSASLASTLVTFTSIDYWRIPYLFSIITALVGLYLRRFAIETPEFIALVTSKQQSLQKISFLQALKFHKKNALCVMAVAIFFSVLYCLPALFLSTFVPMVSDLSYFESFTLNSLSLIIYLIALIAGGTIADKLGIARSMTLCALVTFVMAIPLFRMLYGATLIQIFLIKAIFAILGGWFIGPVHAWFQLQFPSWCRYRLISISYCIGSEIGGVSPSLTLWLWHKYHFMDIPACILMVTSIIAILALRYTHNKPPFREILTVAPNNTNSLLE